MAEITDTKTPYEILIRFGDDGKPRGAHAQFIRRITIDGELVKEEIGNAEPLDLKGFPTSTLMSATTRDALAEITRLRGEMNMLTGELSAAQARIAELEKPVATAETAATDEPLAEQEVAG